MSEFRVEIPVSVSAHSSGLSKLEAELTRLYASAQRVGTAASAALSQMGSGAASASAGMQGAAAGAEQAAAGYAQAGAAASAAGAEVSAAGHTAASAAENMSESADKAANSMEKVGDAGQQAGQQASSGLEQAAGAADKFSARMEKSEQSIRKMIGQKINMTLDAIDKVSPVLNKITSGVKNLTSKAWKVAVKMVDFVTAPFRALKNMIMSPIMMTLSITGIGMGASSFVSTFQEFTAGMSNVKALSGATNEEFLKLTETAENLGATTKFTAAEASEGMQYLAMAGWKTNDILAAMPGLLDLAAAGGTSLGTAADIVSDVMTAMGMSANEASRAADIFARTATGSNTTIENLGESLKYAAPAAHAFGLSLSEAATITGMMANAGVKGSMAGTALRASLLEMANPSKKAAEAMSKLNLTFADSSGKMKDMKTIIKDLSTAFGGLSDQEKLSYAEDIFGTRGSSAWLAVIEQGTEEFNRLFESIDKSKGAAREMAETQLDNLAGDVTLLKSAVDGMKISVMKELDPYLRKGVQWLTNKIPEITDKLTNVAKTAIEKFGQVKDFIVGVFNSNDFKKADGFADKLFVAWDKIIAEPFAKWWEGGGKDKILGLVSKIGTNLGQVYHGVISGIFSAIKGEEIDFEGMNLTGLAKAGAEAAKSFISSFSQAFDLGGLIGKMPALLQTALAGFGALKIGGGVLGVARIVRDLKIAFGSVTPVATKAGTAVASVGAKAAAGTGLIAKFGAGIKAIGAGLANIPVWGWVAAAALAAVAIGIDVYNKAQAAHEKALLDTGKAAQQYETEYITAANNVQNAMATMAEIKSIQLKIEENTGGNAQVIKDFQTEIDGILDRTVYLYAKLNRDDLSKDDVKNLQKELDGVNSKTVELTANLIKDGYDEATAQTIIDQYNGVINGAKEITLILSTKGNMPPEEVLQYVSALTELMKTRAEKELLISGDRLKDNQEALDGLSKRLQEIKQRKSEIENDKSKSAEYQSLIQEEGRINTQLEGAKMTVDQINEIKAGLAEINGQAEGILLKIGYEGDLTQEDLNTIAQILSEMGGQEYTATIALKNAGMSEKEMQGLIDKQNELYRNMIETTGGMFTQKDVERGRITQEDYNWWVQDQATKAEIAKKKFDNQVIKDRENIGELVEKRDAAQADVEKYSGQYESIKNDKKLLEGVRNKRDAIMASFEAGEIDYAGRDKQLEQLISEAKGYEWLDAKNNPFADGMLARGLAGEMMGGDPLDSYLKRLNKQSKTTDEKYEAAQANVEKYQEPLDRQYQNEVAKITQDQTAGLGFESGLTTASIQDLADSYGTLNEAGKKAFADALDGIKQLNEQVDYTDKKVDVDGILNTVIGAQGAENAKSAIGDITGALTELKSKYDVFGKDAEGNALIPEGHAEQAAKDLDAINSVLEGMNLDKITDLSQIGSAIEQINALDPSALDFSQIDIEGVASSMSKLGTQGSASANAVKSSLDAAKSAAVALAGEYEVKVKYIEEGSLPEPPHNAYGGIYDGAFLSWVAEDGPEAIIPLGGDKRNRGLDLWLQAGRALGVTEFADGGLMAPYTGLIADIPEDDEVYELPSAGNSSSGGNSISANVSVNPVFQIEGGNSEDILDKLKEKQRELAELFGGAIADQLEDIVANMV